MKAVIFDLGDTLVEYEGLPLSWEEYYPEALNRLASQVGVELTEPRCNAACMILRRFNTRHHPRVIEVSFGQILLELLRSFDAPATLDEICGARAFFQPFRQRLRCFPETRHVLQRLRADGLKLAVFTDVPYGMPTELVLEDIEQSKIEGLLDLVVTSRDVGFRKPAPQTLQYVATRLDCAADEILHVGNEMKDIQVAKAFSCAHVLIDRSRQIPDFGQDRTIYSLTELCD